MNQSLSRFSHALHKLNSLSGASVDRFIHSLDHFPLAHFPLAHLLKARRFRFLIAAWILILLAAPGATSLALASDDWSERSEEISEPSGASESPISRTPITRKSNDTFSSENEDFIGYEAIVHDLNRRATNSVYGMQGSSRRRALANDPFENVLIHAGVGFANVMQKIELAPNESVDIYQSGVQASLGIDLFTPYWMAEGTARSFGESEQATVRTAIQEFELKVINKDRLFKKLGYRLGLGLTARYLTIYKNDDSSVEFTTPSSVGTLGFDLFFSERFSLGAEVNARTALISETSDRNSIDATLRFDTHF